MTKRPLFCMAITIMLASCVTAPPPQRQAPQLGQEASIPFLNNRGIDHWAADGDSAIYLQDAFHRWYHAKLFAPCPELSFANRIGIETRGNDTLDRYGTLIVRGKRCQIDSLVHSRPPPKQLKRHKRETGAKADKDAQPR